MNQSTQYQKIQLENLQQIINECRNQLLDTKAIDTSQSNLWYPDELPDLPILKDTLHSLGITQHVYGVAMHVTMPEVTIPIHIDTGPFDWSLNIPVHCFDDSFVALYDTAEKPSLKYLPNNVTYLGFESEEQMQPHIKISSQQPMLLNVKKPHNVMNSGNRIRVMMLIRLKRTFDINQFIDNKLVVSS